MFVKVSWAFGDSTSIALGVSGELFVTRRADRTKSDHCWIHNRDGLCRRRLHY